MWQELVAKVSKVMPALAKTADGAAEIVLSVSGTAVLVAIPSWLAGRYVEVTMDGAEADVLFGASDVVAVYGQVSSVDGTTKAITTHVSSGRHLADGVTRSWIIPMPSTATHMSVIASAAGKLYIGSSSTKVSR